MLLQHTIKRGLDHVRGRLEDLADPTSSFHCGQSMATTDAACSKILEMWNGDIRRREPEHYC
eukprot:4346280-Lingulodinium_polyedra.AAC.1